MDGPPTMKCILYVMKHATKNLLYFQHTHARKRYQQINTNTTCFTRSSIHTSMTNTKPPKNIQVQHTNEYNILKTYTENSEYINSEEEKEEEKLHTGCNIFVSIART